MLDILIQNGSIIDGTGKKAYIGDIGVSGGKITFHTDKESAARIINASGKIVCPGFIDFHSHGDMVLGQDFAKLCKVSQGITTEIAGQCGSSMFPVRPEKLDLYQTLLSVGTATYPDDMPNWTTFARYLEYAKQVPLAANIKFLVGHGSLRLAVMGYAYRKPTKEELEQMKTLLRECMENGALGMSSGLIYTPSAYAETEELIELAKVVAEYDGLYATHMRNESYDVVNSVKEAIEIGRQSGVRVSISHHKVCGKPNWGLSQETLKLVEDAIAEGIRITLDQYPYTASMTHFDCLYPPLVFHRRHSSNGRKAERPRYSKKIKS